MHDDRTLLWLAAKAVGLAVIEERGGGLPWTVHGDGPRHNTWNPLTDDGDALRLAVTLNLHVEIDAESAGAIVVQWGFDQSGTAAGSIEQDAPLGGDDFAATRRADRQGSGGHRRVRMTRYTLAIACALLAACGEEPQEVQPTSNAGIASELLFVDKDGNRVHRFYDHGNPVYYVTPAGRVQSEHSETCGKNCTRRIMTHSVSEGI
jgi:hypothetical protein